MLRIHDARAAGQRRNGGHLGAREREIEHLQILAQLLDARRARDRGADVAPGPSPGSTPTIVPSRTPKKQ